MTAPTAPSFPLDEPSLDRLWDAVHIQPGDDQTRLFATLDQLSKEQGDETGGLWGHNDVIGALIAEVRRLRAEESRLRAAWSRQMEDRP